MSLAVWLLTQCVKLSVQKDQQAHAKTVYRYKQRNALKLNKLYLAFKQMADEHTHTLTLHRWAKSPKGRSALRCVWMALSLSCLCAKLSPLFSVGVPHSAVWLHTHHSTALKQNGQSPQDQMTRRDRDGREDGGRWNRGDRAAFTFAKISMAPWFLRAQCGCWPIEEIWSRAVRFHAFTAVRWLVSFFLCVIF